MALLLSLNFGILLDLPAVALSFPDHGLVSTLNERGFGLGRVGIRPSLLALLHFFLPTPASCFGDNVPPAVGCAAGCLAEPW